jgi:anti-anti-sigma regulatory factor
MNEPVNTAATYLAHRRADRPFECGGAAVRVQCRHLATVVTVSGAVDTNNADRVGDYARRFMLPDTPFVLDLSGVDTFAPQAVRLLHGIDAACSAAGFEWAVIPSQAVSLTLLVTHEDATFPAAESLHEALHYFADATTARRHLLLPLLHKSA